MTKEILKKSHIQIAKSVSDWKAAIRLCAQPLLEEGDIKSSYVEAMIQTVLDLGSYIVLAPNIALPHARSDNNVMKDSVSLLKLEEPVYFDKNEDSRATLIISIACCSNEGHLDMLARLATILGDGKVIDRLLLTQNIEEIYQMFSNI